VDGNLLGRFLRDRRARITVETAGLPPRRSSRSGTLTQEDLAQLTGYSTRTISALEQGAEHRPTRELLDAITAVLQLSSEERRTLWQLASGTPPPEVPQAGPDDHDTVLSRIVDLQDPCPAYVCDAAYNVQAHNRAFTAWVWDFMAQPPERRNFARWLFGHPHARHILPNWETDTYDFVARVRQVFARQPRHSGFADLIADLEEHSPQFRRMWRSDTAVMSYPTSLVLVFRAPGHTDPRQPQDQRHHVPLTMSTLTPMAAGDSRRFVLFLYPDGYRAATPPAAAACTACQQDR
jgi:transcriptional regulator with XRE-family HTH domain